MFSKSHVDSIIIQNQRNINNIYSKINLNNNKINNTSKEETLGKLDNKEEKKEESKQNPKTFSFNRQFRNKIEKIIFGQLSNVNVKLLNFGCFTKRK